MSPKRRLAVKKRGLKKAIPRNDTPKLSLRQLTAVLRTSTGDSSLSTTCRGLREKLNRHTPFGPLLVELRVPLIDGKPDLQWLVCNPFALLHILVTQSPKFCSLLLRSLMSSGDSYCGGLALYSDETTHGNQKRHDSSNDVQCVYWCVPQLPYWFRSRKFGWFRYVFLRKDVQNLVRGGLSGLLRIVLKHFYNPSWFNFADGMRVRLMSGGGATLIKLNFMCFIQDEKALPNIFFVDNHHHNLFPSSQN